MNLLRKIHQEEAPNTSVTEWLKELAAWSGQSVSALWKWWNGERPINPTARKLFQLRKHLPAELKAKVKDL